MMVCIKISVAHRNFDLVDLLKILTGQKLSEICVGSALNAMRSI